MMIHRTFKSQRASSMFVRGFAFYFFAAFAFLASAKASSFDLKEIRLFNAASTASTFNREFTNTAFDAKIFNAKTFNAKTFGQDFSLASFTEKKQSMSVGGFGDSFAGVFADGIVGAARFSNNFPDAGFNEWRNGFAGATFRDGFNLERASRDFDKATFVRVFSNANFDPNFVRGNFSEAAFDWTSFPAGLNASKPKFSGGDTKKEFVNAGFAEAKSTKVSSITPVDADLRSVPAVDDLFIGARFDGSFNEAEFDRIPSAPVFNAFAKDFLSRPFGENAKCDFQNLAVNAKFSSGQSEHQTEVAVLNYGPLRQPRNDGDLYNFGLDVRPIYYTEYSSSGGVLIGKRFQMSKDVKELVIYSEDPYVKRYVQQGQVVRILARAERGETLWIFVETSNHPGGVYAKTGLHNYGAVEKLQEFNSSTGDAYRMYFARAYGDTVLDLGYADYSKIAGKGEATISVKKGDDPEDLKTIQTITLAYK